MDEVRISSPTSKYIHAYSIPSFLDHSYINILCLVPHTIETVEIRGYRLVHQHEPGFSLQLYTLTSFILVHLKTMDCFIYSH